MDHGDGTLLSNSLPFEAMQIFDKANQPRYKKNFVF